MHPKPVIIIRRHTTVVTTMKVREGPFGRIRLIVGLILSSRSPVRVNTNLITDSTTRDWQVVTISDVNNSWSELVTSQ